MTENPAVEEKETPAVEEPKPEEKKPEEPKPKEKSSLEQKRDELLKAEEKPAEEKKPEEEFEVQDVDWDVLMEKYPELAKLGVDSVEKLAERYAGGLKDFQADRDFVAQLEKLGIANPQDRDELLAKLKAKEDVTPSKKPEPEKVFKDTRKEKLSQLIPKQRIDPETEQLRDLTGEEKVQEVKKLENFAESISPAYLPDAVDDLQEQTLNHQDELNWALFRLQPILEEHKDKLLSNDIRKQILDHSKQFPLTYKEIVQNAIKNGKNYYEAVYHHFITSTKQEQIDAEKKKRWKEEDQKEEEKKKATKVETEKRAGESLEPQKTFAEKSLMAKRKAIEGAGG